MLASAFSPMTGKAVAEASKAKADDAQATTSVAQALPDDHLLTYVSVESYVRDYFRDTPILAEVAKCESTFRQFDSKGRIVRGRENPDDIGIMQINTFYHGDSAENLGYDLFTLDGNLGFAKWLYSKYGDAPWVHSSKCWKKYSKVARS
jgi:hypothetical protein